ncbi:MAG: hydantoinase B/oxoprolinase family protein, partial [Isosphaeraceae bacterium]
DVVRAFVNNTRIPTQIARDLSAEVGSVHLGVRAVADLADQYGVENLEHILNGLCEFSEAMFRARLRQIPDGVYEAADYIEDGYADDSVYRALVKMTVAEDEVFFDFRGSSEAAPALLNCARSGLVGGVMGPLIEQLATGIPFNAGVMKPVHVRSDTGSFIDSAFPTPIGLATGYGAWAVSDAAWSAASAALEASGDDFLRGRAAAQAGGGAHCSIFSGASNQHGEYSIFLNMDGPGGPGLGALEGLDGARGTNVMLWGSIPSVEAHESHEPFLYLSREFWRDSPGAGEWRGGPGIKSAVVVWGEKSSPQSGTFCSVRNAVPTMGRSGGYPASGTYYGPVSDTPVCDELEDGKLSTCTEIELRHGDSFESLPSKSMWEGARFLHKGPGGEVFIQTAPGGGGMGDPLNREPGKVGIDVREGVVSVEAARGIYGVITDEEGNVDEAATAERRQELRASRIQLAERPGVVAA